MACRMAVQRAVLKTLFSRLSSPCYVTGKRVAQLERNVALSRNVTMSVATKKKETINVVYALKDGRKVKAQGKEGDNLLDIAIANDVDIDGFGACEGTLACSTCHLIFKSDDFNSLPEEATDEELDMLDLAYELTPTSRLGCQICVSKELDGIEVQVPAQTNDARG